MDGHGCTLLNSSWDGPGTPPMHLFICLLCAVCVIMCELCIVFSAEFSAWGSGGGFSLSFL